MTRPSGHLSQCPKGGARLSSSGSLTVVALGSILPVLELEGFAGRTYVAARFGAIAPAVGLFTMWPPNLR
ncbi:hypothetical protein MES4922_300001 [Mesorhizobium ventifaucium]|uniref:MFS transporter n=1 Tax=Mesorhizobium ventifaucium TaxID=666020 RepID=A0ABN8JXH3_9HYPH|nr:hypothetical protein MES4922_300001 [Mesorhizobium ventifaucium]